MYHPKLHFHFVGIGGIGMSGIAKILAHRGYTVSGCDITNNSADIQELLSLGCAISNHHHSQLCIHDSIDVYVYSSDVKKDIPEFIYAQKKNIPIIHRSQALAYAMKSTYNIAISGSHGKTTTTGMIAHIFLHAKKDPNIIIGGHLPSIQNNAHAGSGDFTIAEADESDRSFLNLPADIAILTNIDKEHMSTYNDIEDLCKTCLQFINKISWSGTAIICSDNLYIKNILPYITAPVITYGTNTDAYYQARNIQLHSDTSTFDLYKDNNFLGNMQLNVPGIHNVLNSVAACAAALQVGISFESIQEALTSFISVDRRFTFKGKTAQGALIYDDYGHHPTEILATLLVAKNKTKGKVFIAFQPQRYSRTYHLWNEFIEFFSTHFADLTLITDIYEANETPIQGIESCKLVEEIYHKNSSSPVMYFPSTNNFEQISSYLKQYAHKDDLIVLLGAGKINTITHDLMK